MSHLSLPNIESKKYGKVHIFWEDHKILRNLHLTYVWTVVKSKVKISQNLVAFSEYINFTTVDSLQRGEKKLVAMCGHLATG